MQQFSTITVCTEHFRNVGYMAHESRYYYIILSLVCSVNEASNGTVCDAVYSISVCLGISMLKYNSTSPVPTPEGTQHQVPRRRNACCILTCHTPTTALAMRMRRMTKGSTKAVTCSSDSSNHANTCNTTSQSSVIFS